MPRWNKNYFSFSFGDHPLITKSPYGLDLKIRNIPEPVSQPVDMHIHSADIGLGIISPQLVHDLLTGKGMVREGQQLVQQLKFLLRKDLGIIVNRDGQIDIVQAHMVKFSIFSYEIFALRSSASTRSSSSLTSIGFTI